MSSRPRIRPPMASIEWFLLFMGAAALLVHAYYIGTLDLAESVRVPLKFDLEGRVIAWGSASNLWVLWGVSALISIVTPLVAAFPWTHNFPWKVTARNAPPLYRLSRSLLLFVAAWINTSFFILNRQTVEVALQLRSGLDPGIFILVIATPIVALGYFFMRGRQIARKSAEIL